MMNLQETTTTRLNLMKFMQEKQYSPELRSLIRHHIVNLEKYQGFGTGNPMIEDMMDLVLRGVNEKEIREIAQKKYGMKMSLIDYPEK